MKVKYKKNRMHNSFKIQDRSMMQRNLKELLKIVRMINCTTKTHIFIQVLVELN